MAVRMLIIDHEPEICDFLRDIALGIGYEVVTANRAEDFKRAFAATGADVILLDLTLPGTGGIELLKYMAELGTRAHPDRQRLRRRHPPHGPHDRPGQGPPYGRRAGEAAARRRAAQSAEPAHARGRGRLGACPTKDALFESRRIWD
jgi:hypothetical protein